MADNLTHQPPPHPTYLLSYPAPHVLLITINRPHAMNSLPYAAHWEADALIQWFDAEPELRVVVITGKGKAFCAGQDLIEQRDIAVAREQAAQKKTSPGRDGQGKGGVDELDRRLLTHPPSGFMGVSRRAGKKPVIAAVNGWAMGGGFEIVLGCDMVVASPKAIFGLPEASRGLWAAAGGLSRLVRLAGMMVASEIAMSGRTLSASEAVQYHVANKVSKTPESVVEEAVELASKIGALSPDAIIITRQGLRDSWEYASVERASQVTESRYGAAFKDSPNLAIGLKAFAEKKQPQWVPPKL